VWPHGVESFQCSTFCLLWCSSCYGTAVGHRSLLNRSGICDRIVCCNIFFVHTAVLSIQTVFNLVKIHLLIWNRHGHECSRIWKLSGNFTLIQCIKSVEIFWAEIYWGRLIFRAESSLFETFELWNFLFH
jgi:hypothetical protein